MNNRLLRGISVFVVLLALTPAEAQHGPDVVRVHQRAPEERVSGTVAAVLPQGKPGTLPGSHLLLTTMNGSVDVSLGMLAFKGKSALSISAGEQVEVIGGVKLFRGKPVLVAQSVTVRDRTYAIRNEHDVPVTPKARERAANSAQDQEPR